MNDLRPLLTLGLGLLGHRPLHLLREVDLAEHAARWAEHHRRARWIAAAAPFADEDAFFVLETELRQAGQQLAAKLILGMVADRKAGRPMMVPEAFVDALLGTEG